MFALAFERWKLFGTILADFQFRAFAAIFYFTIMVPFGLGVRLLGDPLDIKSPEAVWLEREPVSASLDDAQLQG